MRRKLLEHVSYRSSAILNSLPSDLVWTRSSHANMSSFGDWRIIRDETWSAEFQGAKCLTLGALADHVRQLCAGAAGAPGQDPRSFHGKRFESLASSPWPRTLVVVREGDNGAVTMLDGNHRAALLFAGGVCLTGLDDSGGRWRDEVDVLVGQFNQHSASSWKFWRSCPGDPAPEPATEATAEL